MSSSLTMEYFASKGINANKGLKDWLSKAASLARLKTSKTERARYEQWALNVVLTAASSALGVAGTDWKKISAVMPTSASLLAPSACATTAVNSAGSSDMNYREALYREASIRCSPELIPHVQQAFQLYDADVAAGKRQYRQVSFIEMLNIATSLYNRHLISAPALTTAAPCAPVAAAIARNAQITTSQLPVAMAPLSQARTRPREYTEANVLTVSKRPRIEDGIIREDIQFFSQLSDGKQSSSPLLVERAFVGLSHEMERMYSRYEPNPEDIRPPSVLNQAFAFVKERAAKKAAQEGLATSQKYLSDQLKGMRQDLRVQNIATDFAVSVYEFHARLCLEMGDIGEFNQCQASLKVLYTNAAVLHKDQCSICEFFFYRLVYLSLSQQYDALSTELINYTDALLRPREKRGTAAFVSRTGVRRTLELCAACEDGDVSAIARLLCTFEAGMRFLINIYLQRLRVRWLQEMLCAMKGSISMRFLMANLGFTPFVQHEETCNGEGKKSSTRSKFMWLDGTAELAQRCCSEFFALLKVTLPPNFSFDKELFRDKSKRGSGSVTSRALMGSHSPPSLDAESARASVEQYVVFLGTRKDATI